MSLKTKKQANWKLCRVNWKLCQVLCASRCEICVYRNGSKYDSKCHRHYWKTKNYAVCDDFTHSLKRYGSLSYDVFPEMGRTVNADLKRFQMHRIARVEENDKVLSIFIHNIFEIRKNKASGLIRFFKFNLQRETWVRVKRQDIHIESIGGNFSTSSLPKNGIIIPNFSIFAHNKAALEILAENLLKACLLEVARQRFPKAFKQQKDITLVSLLSLYLSKKKYLKDSFLPAAKYLTKLLWTHFFYKRIAGPMANIMKGSSYLYIYTQELKRNKTFKRLKREHPNLIAMAYKPEASADDFLSQANWAAKGLSPGALRFMKRLPPAAIKAWTYGPSHWNAHVMECVYRATQGLTLSPCVIAAMVNITCDYGTNLRGVSLKSRIHMLRLVAATLEQRKTDFGFRAMRTNLKRDCGFVDHLFDWHTRKGAALGLPDKNFTPTVLLRHVARWDEELQAAAKAVDEARESIVLPFKISSFEEGGYRFEALDTYKKIATESVEMGHCILTYWEDCVIGDYRAYSIVEIHGQGERGTIGFHNNFFDQLRGPNNAEVSQSMKKAVKHFIKTVTKK